MAVKKAVEDKPGKGNDNVSTNTGKLDNVHQGASGGFAPEGYSLPGGVGQGGVENARVDNEGVSQRTPEEDEKRFKSAEAFMKSKVDAEKKALKGETVEQPVKKEVEQVKKEEPKK